MAAFLGQPQAPIPFPPATLHRASTRRTMVMAEKGNMVSSIVISSQSGAHYEKGRRLKEAIYGEVCSGHVLTLAPDGSYQRTGEAVAIKIIFRERLNYFRAQNSPEDPMNEIACMAYIRDTPTSSQPSPPNRYPNLCYFYEACENEHFVFSVMEFVNGDELYDYMDDNGAMLPGEARVAFGQILTGWSVLYSLGISHRDMSLENVMYIGGDCPRAVIIDFGMARMSPRAEDSSHALLPPLGQAGKPQYMAPEVLLNLDPLRGCEVDVWSMSIMLFMLIAGHPPLTTAVEVDDLFRRIVNRTDGGLPGLIRAWRHPFSPECVAMVDGMMRRLGSDRLTHDQLMAHPWWQAESP